MLEHQRNHPVDERGAGTDGRNRSPRGRRPPSRPVLAALAAVILACLGAAAPGEAAAQGESRRQEAYITRAAFADGRLWLLDDEGGLSSITPGRNTRDSEVFDAPVRDLCVQDGAPVVAAAAAKGDWTLRRRTGAAWPAQATVGAHGEGLLAMDCAADAITLVTTRRLITLGGARQTSVKLSHKLLGGLVATAFGTAQSLWVGIDTGQSGGGLVRIDRRSGQLTVLQRNATGQACGGPLNPDCDPVKAIVAEPWRPDCVAVAVGLVHISPHGRVAEVCGDEVKTLYCKAFDSGAFDPCADGGDLETVPFYGLAASDGVLTAAGIDGLYSLGPGGAASFRPLPDFTDIGGVEVSFALPGFVLVLTEAGARDGMGAAAPLLVPR